MTTTLVESAKNYVTALLDDRHAKQWPFHNLHHVRHVVQKCQELIDAHGLDKTQGDEITIAAWFHDVGYTQGSAGHEQAGCEMARRFLNGLDVAPASIDRIAQMILATIYPSQPATLQEQILCDADLHHLASGDYFEWSALLYQEMVLHGHGTLTKLEWDTGNIAFFKGHRYFTGFANLYWEPKKQINLQLLKTKTQNA